MAQSSSTHSQQGQAQQLLAPGAKRREGREVPMADSRLKQPWSLGWDLTQTSAPFLTLWVPLQGRLVDVSMHVFSAWL